MNNLIGDFEETFLTDKSAFKLLAKRFENANKTGTLKELFGPEQAKNIFKFGKIMSVLGKSAEGGDLVAANIAANPFQNIGRIGKFFVIGKVLSNEAMYKSFAAKYGKEAAKKQTQAGKMQVFLNVMNQMAASFVKQSGVREVVGGVSDAREQSREALDNITNRVVNPTPRTRTSIPDVSPVFEVPEVSSISGPQTSIRDRVRDNPALAASLLGGLDNIGFV
jgi:hypothetical protein